MGTNTPIHGWIEVFPVQALGAKQVGSYTERAEVARTRECRNNRGRRLNSCTGKTSDGVLPASGSPRTGAACSSARRSWRGGWACTAATEPSCRRATGRQIGGGEPSVRSAGRSGQSLGGLTCRLAGSEHGLRPSVRERSANRQATGIGCVGSVHPQSLPRSDDVPNSSRSPVFLPIDTLPPTDFRSSRPL